MTGAQLVSRVKQHVGNVSGTNVNDAWYLDRVNEGYRALWSFKDLLPTGRTRILRFPELYNVATRVIASGLTSNFIANSTGVAFVWRLWNDTDTTPIKQRSAPQLMESDPTATGTLSIWAPFGDANVAGYLIWRLPTVSTTVREYTYQYPEALTDSATAPVIADEWHPHIHLAGGAKAAELIGEQDLATRLHQQFVLACRATKLKDDDPLAQGGSRVLQVGPRTH